MANYWLLKSEPNVYSIDDLERDGHTCWEGVRNYAARNNMRAMAVGDLALFYHSNANPPGVALRGEKTRQTEKQNSQGGWWGFRAFRVFRGH